MEVSGLILAGGASSRMGRNKALLKLAGRPLVARVVAALEPLTDEILIVSNNPAPYRFCIVPLSPISSRDMVR